MSLAYLSDSELLAGIMLFIGVRATHSLTALLRWVGASATRAGRTG